MSAVMCCCSAVSVVALSAVTLANISVMCLVQCFQGDYSLCSAFRLCLNFPQPFPPFNFSLINHWDRCLVPLVWGLMAGRLEFTSHEGVTLSKG